MKDYAPKLTLKKRYKIIQKWLIMFETNTFGQGLAFRGLLLWGSTTTIGRTIGRGRKVVSFRTLTL